MEKFGARKTSPITIFALNISVDKCARSSVGMDFICVYTCVCSGER